MTKKKKTLIVVLSILIVIVLAVGITLAVLLTRKPDKPPVQEGAIYQTESKIIWSGVAGVAYISFEYVEEPETPEDGELYGYVFKVMADGSTDVAKCTPWLSGAWELEENDGTYGNLILTASWDESNSDATKLTGATSGEAKTYTLDGGVYKIGVSFSAGANLTFTLDPTNRLDDGNKPTEPCTEHVDSDNDGKCDKCGENMPNQGGEATVQSTLAAKSEGGQQAKIELMDDATWSLSIKYWDGGDYTPTASGTWVMDTTTYNITLSVTDDTADVLAEETYTLTVNYETFAYSGTIVCTIPQVGTVSFDFATATEESTAKV